MSRLRPYLPRFLWILLVAVPLLTGCYLPDEFAAEVRVAATGEYAITYRGLLTWVPLYSEIRQHKLSAKETREKLADIEKDLRRDTNFKEIQSLGDGRFRVRFERSGRLKESEMVTFVRRNAMILSMTALKDGTLKIQGTSLGKDHAAKVSRMGLGMRGTLRVVTGATVKSSNANRTGSNGPFRVYDWKIDTTMRASPKIVIRLMPGR
ncbi:MAG: hypothetical protein ABT940_00820 [Alphaproteobacteria bacterium]